MPARFEPTPYRIRIGVTGDRELGNPSAIEWQLGCLVPEVSIEARSGPSRSRTLLIGKDDEQVGGLEYQQHCGQRREPTFHLQQLKCIDQLRSLTFAICSEFLHCSLVQHKEPNMIDRLTISGFTLYVHLGEISLKSTKSFTHGRLAIDTATRTVAFGSLPPVAFPDGFVPTAGATLNLQLVGPDGRFRKQTRSGVLRPDKRQVDILRIPGKAKTESRFSAEDGWGQAVYKFRAYFTHPGIETDGDVPKWLQESIARQRIFWNRLAWLCREARRKCSPVSAEEIAKFVQEKILPDIDAFNDAVGDFKQKIKHPTKLKAESPGLDGLWKFAGSLRGRIEKGRQALDGLLERVVAYAAQFKADYTPLNDFLNNLNAIVEREAKALPMPIEGVPFEENHRIVELRHYEVRPIVSSFKAALARRKTAKVAWSEGWPLIK